jgi:hypothetical protein
VPKRPSGVRRQIAALSKLPESASASVVSLAM